MLGSGENDSAFAVSSAQRFDRVDQLQTTARVHRKKNEMNGVLLLLLQVFASSRESNLVAFFNPVPLALEQLGSDIQEPPTYPESPWRSVSQRSAT